MRSPLIRELKRGEWLGSYPVGYAYEKPPRRTKYSRAATVAIDPEKSLIVKDIFTMYAEGKISLKNLTEYIRQKYSNYKPHMSRIHLILQNKFYIGIMVWKGHEYPHHYPTFIEKELFDHCQKVLQFNNKHILYGEKFYNRPVRVRKRDTVRTENITQTIPELILKTCKEPHTIEQLCSLTKISLKELRVVILDLEIEGKIRDNGSGFWFTP